MNRTKVPGTLMVLALLAALPARGQEPPLADVQRKLTAYSEGSFQEKIYVHVDRPLYVVGETLWFKIYCVAADTRRGANLSKIAYLELLDDESNPVAQVKVSLTNGQGDGNLPLPATLANGTYTVRCYTNWMKNFDASYFFEAPVTVLNPFVAPNRTAAAQSDTPAAAPAEVLFFPEGGNLVAGLPSRVAFRVVGPDGRGMKVKGAVVDQNNDTLARFEPLRFGLGSFTFTPDVQSTYRAVVQAVGSAPVRHPLPAVSPQGTTMGVQKTDNRVDVTVRSTAGSSPVSLLVRSSGQPPRAFRQALQNGRTVFSLPQSTLGEGTIHLTVFDASTRPVAERLYFVRPARPLTFTAATDRATYGTREKVQLDLAASAAESTTLSVAVYLLDSLAHPPQTDIDAYLSLLSDLPGTVESPEYYFQNSGPEVDEALDHLMLTHGWRRFRWEEVLLDRKAAIRHLPEYSGHFIRGRVVHTETGKSEGGIGAYLATPDLRPRLFIAESDSLGNLLFEVKGLSDTREIIVQTNARFNGAFRVEVDAPYSTQPSARRWPDHPYRPEWSDQLLTRSVNMQTLNAFAERLAGRPVVGTDSLAFFGQPDERYLLDDFTRFPTMEEVMREYVPGVIVRRQQGKFNLYVLDNGSPQGLFTDQPLILLDGVPVFDTDKIMAFDPLKIKKLEVVDALYYLGPRAFPGIVSYTTYKGDLAGFELDPNALVRSYDFAQSAREFYAPRYGMTRPRDSRLPDFRNLLHWSPTLTTDASGRQRTEFYTSDQPGTYRVVVQGLTSGGSAGSGTHTFEVRAGVGQ